MEVVPVGTEVWIVKTCSVVWMSEDGISVTTLSLCCATTAPANRSRVEPTAVERMVRVVAKVRAEKLGGMVLESEQLAREIEHAVKLFGHESV